MKAIGLKIWCPPAFLYQFIMDSSNKKSTLILPIDASEGKLEEKMNNVQFEVMDTIAITPNLVYDTETSKAIVSNLD